MRRKTTRYRPTNSTLFEEHCRNSCEVLDQCGGTFTSPCSCVKSGTERFKCSSCNIICRDRRAPANGLFPKDNFSSQIKSGLPLEDVYISQRQPKVPFPLVIPSKTHLLKIKYNSSFIGIQLKQLITKAIRPNLKQAVTSKKRLKQHFNLSNKTNLIAVLNTDDEYLEALWRMPDRNRFYEVLKRMGIEYVTGPTFSVVEETYSMPASHNVAMLLRHNKIMQELYDHGLIPIPNIYWRSELDIDNWLAWIAINNSVEFIARDFSMVSKGKGISPIVKRFIEFLKDIKKPIHVIFTGAGLVTAKYLMKEFNELDHTCSFVTSQPIASAMLGGKKLNPFRLVYLKDHKRDRNELADYNLRSFEDLLLQQLPEINHDQLNFF